MSFDLFGYVKPFAPDLYVREFDLYKAVYCGICREMKRTTGILSTASLSYDMVFLALVRMAVSDEKLDLQKRACTVNPLCKRHMICGSPSIEYCARASALLTYNKILDDRADEKGGKRFLATLLSPIAKRAAARAKLFELSEEIRRCMEKLSETEAARIASVDEPADAFGELLGAVFAYGFDGEVGENLFDVGFHLGRFIYAADAAEDWEEDIARGSYNPFILLYGEDHENPTYRKEIHGALLYSASLAAGAIDRLGLEGKDAARNILMNTLCEGLPMRIGFLIGEETPTDAFPHSEHRSCRNCGGCKNRN